MLTRLVYLGTAPLAVPVLEYLHQQDDLELLAVYSQPDRPSGRARRLSASPVKQCALSLGLPVFTPEKIGSAKGELLELAPDALVVFAYGQYIPASIFRLPPLGSINLHPSLLPKYRGASPIQTAIANGDPVSGISVLEVSERMDAGALLAQERIPIPDDATSETMSETYARAGGPLLAKVLRDLREGRARPLPQDEAAATETRKLEKEDGRVDWSLPAQVLHNRLRAYQPWPSLFLPVPNGVLKLLEVRIEEGSGPPGRVLELGREGPLVACGSGALRLLRLQPPGRNPMPGGAFLNGHTWQVGDQL